MKIPIETLELSTVMAKHLPHWKQKELLKLINELSIDSDLKMEVQQALYIQNIADSQVTNVNFIICIFYRKMCTVVSSLT